MSGVPSTSICTSSTDGMLDRLCRSCSFIRCWVMPSAARASVERSTCGVPPAVVTAEDASCVPSGNAVTTAGWDSQGDGPWRSDLTIRVLTLWDARVTKNRRSGTRNENVGSKK